MNSLPLILYKRPFHGCLRRSKLYKKPGFLNLVAVGNDREMDKRDETAPDPSVRRRQHGQEARDKKLTVRVSGAEHAVIKERATEAGLSVGGFLAQRGLSVGDSIPVGHDDASIDLRILRELMALNRQLAHYDNADRELVNRIEDLIVEVANYIRQSSGR